MPEKIFFARESFQASDDDWTEIKGAYDAREAAEMYSDEIWPHSEGAESFDIEVKDMDGTITPWLVEVDFYPTFYASEPRNKHAK